MINYDRGICTSAASWRAKLHDHPAAKAPAQKPGRADPAVAAVAAGAQRTAQGLTAAAARSEFAPQVCSQCGQVQYPPRDVCGNCLATDLAWRAVDDRGTLIATTDIAISSEVYFRERAPWRTES